MAGKALGDWETEVRNVLGGIAETVVTTDLIDQGIALALRTFSNDRPQEKQADLAGDGVAYQFNLPTGWIVGFSTVLGVEYPQGRRPPEYLDLQEVHPYPDNDSATKIMFDLTTPSNATTVRLTFTAPWPVPDATPATDLVPATDFDAVCHLAGSYVAGWKAAGSAPNTRSSFPTADLAGISDESARWTEVSRWARKMYDQHVGAYGEGDESPVPASTTLDWDGMSDFVPLGGRFLTHRTRR